MSNYETNPVGALQVTDDGDDGDDDDDGDGDGDEDDDDDDNYDGGDDDKAPGEPKLTRL